MPNRRTFVRGVAVAAAGMWVTSRAGDLAAGALQGVAAPRRRQITIGGRRVKTIDVHAHVTIPEAAALLDAPEAESENEMLHQADRLIALGANAVLIKGGHASGAESIDVLVTATASLRVIGERIATRNTHGTGCTLSAAIAAGLARGRGLTETVRDAKEYITSAIAAADRLAIGNGPGPVHHFYRWW